MKNNIEHAYIHIPFCIRKCRYCSFVSGFDLSFKKEYLNALKLEIKNRYKGGKLKTLYIGGGTPSLLSGDDIAGIISLFDVSELTEITLEANPETVTEDKFKAYHACGVNRISLGVQTFDENILSFIGRNHVESDIIKAVSIIKSSGFDNMSIDLIYGLPMQTSDKLSIDLTKALNLGIKHISTYGLKLEKGSYFDNHPIDNLPDDEMQSEMYKYICDFLSEKGFNHYEISNFSLPGYSSRHNCAYWQNKNYYGFGLNASGYESNTRYTNVSDLNKYISYPGSRAFEENLTPVQKLEEEIILSLRLSTGVDIASVNKKFGIDFSKKYSKIIDKYIKTGLLKLENGRCFLTEDGFLLSNEIMSDFIE